MFSELLCANLFNSKVFESVAGPLHVLSDIYDCNKLTNMIVVIADFFLSLICQ